MTEMFRSYVHVTSSHVRRHSSLTLSCQSMDNVMKELSSCSYLRSYATTVKLSLSAFQRCHMCLVWEFRGSKVNLTTPSLSAVAGQWQALSELFLWHIYMVMKRRITSSFQWKTLRIILKKGCNLLVRWGNISDGSLKTSKSYFLIREKQ